MCIRDSNKTEQTHRYITAEHEMKIVFSENTGEYLNKKSENIISSSKKEKIKALTEENLQSNFTNIEPN